MQVKLSDGRIATAFDVYTGKSRQIMVDGEQMFWPRDQMEEVKPDEELKTTTIPAIDRLEELLRYGKAGVETTPDYWKLVTELREEARQDRIKEWGV